MVMVKIPSKMSWEKIIWHVKQKGKRKKGRKIKTTSKDNK